MQKIRLSVDVMGFENNITEAINACVDFVNENKNVDITLVGKKREIQTFLKPHSNIYILDAKDVILQTDSVLSLRTKKNSSMAKAIELVKNNEADGVLSAGNSAIYIFLCYQILGLIPGVKVPGFMPYIPTFKGTGFNLLDVGASINCTGYDLHMFALMANIYTRCRAINKPRIGILNIGTETHKGHDFHRDGYNLIREDKNLNFIGFVEPKELLEGKVDVVVSDGFSGNICLKSLEGTSKSIFNDMLNYYKNPLHWLLFPFVAPYLLKVKKKFDYKNNAGAFVIGLNGLAIKTHGSADYKQFYSSLRMLKESVQYDILNEIKKELNNETKYMKK